MMKWRVLLFKAKAKTYKDTQNPLFRQVSGC